MAAPKLHTGPAVIIDPKKLQAFIRQGNGPVVRDMLIRGERVKLRAKELVGVKTGNLRDHIVKRLIEAGGQPTVVVGVDKVAYARFHHQGTPPHVIQGRPLLVFFWPKAGRVVYLPRVNHPGTKPNPFLVRALTAGAGG